MEPSFLVVERNTHKMTDTETLTTPPEKLDVRRVNEILCEDHNHVFRLDELLEVNLFDVRLRTSGGKEYPLQVQHHQHPKSFFHIYELEKVHAGFTPSEWKKMEELLLTTNYTFTVRYYGPHYFSNSHGHRSVGLELDAMCFPRSSTLYLRDFGSSYGKVEVNGIECDISHSGGTWDLSQGTDRDVTHGWWLVGRKKSHPIIRSLLPPPTNSK